MRDHQDLGRKRDVCGNSYYIFKIQMNTLLINLLDKLDIASGLLKIVYISVISWFMVDCSCQNKIDE